MKNSLLENKVNQTIREFDNLENIEPSSDWNQTLMERIASEQSNNSSEFSGVRFNVLVLLLILINITFFIGFSNNNNFEQKSIHNEDLRSISKELLSISNSLNE